MIRLLLVEDHESFREPLAFLLDRQPDLTVVGEARTLAEARTKLIGVDVALLDLDLPDGIGTDLIHDLRLINPDASVLVLTGSSNQIDHARAIEQGANAVLNKVVSTSKIISAIRALAAGTPVHSQAEIIEFLQSAGRERERKERSQSRFVALTPRERETLSCLARGMSEKDIARERGISTRTAHNHLVSILRKLNVESRLQAVLISLKVGLISIDPDDG